MQVRKVNVDEIETSNQTGKDDNQVRNGGIVPSHVSDLASSILSDGVKVPVTLEKIVGTGRYRCVDGNHRVQAVKNLKSEGLHPGDVPAEVEHFKGRAARILKQIELNDHDPALRNTYKDLLYNFTRLVKVEGACGDLSLYPTDEDKIAKIREYILAALPGYKDSLKLSRAVFDAMPTDLKKIRSYTKAAAIEEFNNKNTIGCDDVTKAGQFSNGIVPYFCSDENELPAMVGHAIFKDNKYAGKVEIVVVAWLGKSTGKEPRHVEAFRKKFLQKVSVANKYSPADRTLVSKVLFLPQILENGNKAPDTHVLIEHDMAFKTKEVN